MSPEDFGRWTSSCATTWHRPARRRAFAVVCGVACLALGAGFLGLELRGSGEAGNPGQSARMSLTVPELRRVDDVPVGTAPASDENALRGGVVRLAGTGLPWQREPNVYISGHRLGYPGTESFMVFRDLSKLESGDEVRLRDDEGRRYSYRVFDRRVVGPGETAVTEPVEGRNIVSLQTCTLPDYRERLVVRAELSETSTA